MNKEVCEHIAALRKSMKEHEIDAYLIPTADYHNSEYVGAYFGCRKFMTGFTGSAGTALITPEFAGLWTDGRYFVQAGAQLAGTGIELMKMGNEGVPTIVEYLIEHLPEQGRLGFDGRVVTADYVKTLHEKLDPKHITMYSEEPLVDPLWLDRPAMSCEPVWVLDEQYTGESGASRLFRVREEMKKAGVDLHLITTLDDIVWLLNIRGNDVPCNPVVLSYLMIGMEEATLYVQEAAISSGVEAYLNQLSVKLRPYQEVYEAAAALSGHHVMVDVSKVNDSLFERLGANNQLVEAVNPAATMKILKNATEIENTKRAHIKDAVTMVRFLKWLKNTAAGCETGAPLGISEVEAADRLDQMRRDNGAMDISFDTISAYGANAAMCHYHAETETCAQLLAKGLYLVDSGGQYLEGTTDITRTIALGNITDEERKHFTLVLMGMLRLGHAKFPEYCNSTALDYAARSVLWQEGLDFNHGTGHGVGYLLNVHEGPVAIRSRFPSGVAQMTMFRPGMVCSDEPGLYIEGSHGIRTENLMHCVEGEKNEYGHFYGFEFFTFVPIDLDAIDSGLMTRDDINYLNEYHHEVYEKLSPFLTEEECEWLQHATRAI